MSKHDRRELAIVTDYPSLHDALRLRAQELQISRLSIDHLGGLADGHASKILALSKIRRMGLSALGPMLRALGVELILVENPEQMARNAKRVDLRREYCVRHKNGAQPSNSSAA